MVNINIIKNNHWLGNSRPAYFQYKYINIGNKSANMLYQMYGSGDIKKADALRQVGNNDTSEIEQEKYKYVLAYCANTFKVNFLKNYR
jgi:exosome complex RNA-binding protein Csl4